MTEDYDFAGRLSEQAEDSEGQEAWNNFSAWYLANKNRVGYLRIRERDYEPVLSIDHKIGKLFQRLDISLELGLLLDFQVTGSGCTIKLLTEKHADKGIDIGIDIVLHGEDAPPGTEDEFGNWLSSIGRLAIAADDWVLVFYDNDCFFNYYHPELRKALGYSVYFNPTGLEKKLLDLEPELNGNMSAVLEDFYGDEGLFVRESHLTLLVGAFRELLEESCA